MNRWELLQLTLDDNSKSEEERGNYLDNTQTCSEE